MPSTLLGGSTCILDEITEDQIIAAASTFCGDQIPVILGRPNQGFNVSTMKQVCGGHSNALLKHDAEILNFCEEQEEKLGNVSRFASNFLGALEDFDYLLLLYRKAVLDKAAQLRQEIQTESFRRSVENARPSEKMNVVVSFYKQSLNEFAADLRMEEAVAVVSKAVETLVEAVQIYLHTLPEYLANCNKLYLGTSSQQDALLHICKQNSGNDCMDFDHPEVSQVAACCAFNPVAQGPSIPGTSGRRLATADENWAQTPHLCAESHHHLRRSIEVIRLMYESGGAEQARAYEESLRQKYPNFFADTAFSKCPTSTGTTTTLTTTKGTTLTTTRVAAETAPASIEGCIELSTTNVEAFAADPLVEVAMKEAVTVITGVAITSVKELGVVVGICGRRLEGRNLQEGNAAVDFVLEFSFGSAAVEEVTAAQQKLSTASVQEVQSMVESAMEQASVTSFSVTVNVVAVQQVNLPEDVLSTSMVDDEDIDEGDGAVATGIAASLLLAIHLM